MPNRTSDKSSRSRRTSPKTSRTRRRATGAKSAKKKWVASINTESTHPPAGLFNKSAATIARTLASKKVSPHGPRSGMSMLNFFINRGGRGLSASRRRELEKAKGLLSQRIARDREKKKAA